MIEHRFSPEMMQEREKQLILALADCAGEYYDINFTKNQIFGNAIQMVNGVAYSIHEAIGLPENSSYTDFIDYWRKVIAPEEQTAFSDFFDLDHIHKSFAEGKRLLTHRYWTKDVLGNPMLAVHRVRLYMDHTTGDLLGLAYVSDEKQIDSILQSEAKLADQYNEASTRLTAMELLAAKVPAGYHRCGTGEGFPLLFVSDSFLDVVGWTREELKSQFDNKYLALVAPEDRDFFLSHEPLLTREGKVDLTYRVCRKDGTLRWIQDSTIRIVQGDDIYYQCTLSDITEYVEKLNAEKAKAEASNLAKSTFLFNASHDIRTPMNAIQGFAHIIAQNTDNPEIVQTTIQKIIQSSNTLMTLLNDVLELSRIEKGKDHIDEQPLNMEDHMKKLHEMFASEMEQAGIHFIMKNDIPHPNIMGDDLKLTRIAMNLLSNAKKFTPQGGVVYFGVQEIPLSENSSNYCLFVQDTGIGMSREFQERAFEQFERERSSTESGINGSGLGLAIIKRLCDLMNGTCEIDSELGLGTKITVTIPLQHAQEQIADVSNIVKHVDFSGKRILLVEDNEFNREIARYILEDMDFIVEEAADGSIAVNKLLKSHPGHFDLVLMDIQMPVMDGYTATKEIRNIKDPAIASVPIIAMTANAFIEDVEKCLESGMNAHISKPFDASKLVHALNELL